MKKNLLILLIAASLISCSTVQNKTQETKKIEKQSNQFKLYTLGQYYESEGVIYDALTDKKLNGVIRRSKKSDYSYSGEYTISLYKDGKLQNKKYLSEDYLLQDMNYKNGELDGKMTFYNSVREKKTYIVEMNFENGILQGPFYSKSEEKYNFKFDIVNAVYHGKVMINKNGKEEITYYNQGEKVENESQIEKFKKLNTENAINFSELHEKESVYYTKDDKIFNGIAYSKTLSNNYGKDMLNYLYIENGKFKKRLGFIKTEQDYYQPDYPRYYELKEIFEVKGDKTYITNYSKFIKEHEVIFDNKKNKLIKQYEFDGFGERKK